jgi:hypothetical protein
MESYKIFFFLQEFMEKKFGEILHKKWQNVELSLAHFGRFFEKMRPNNLEIFRSKKISPTLLKFAQSGHTEQRQQWNSMKMLI